MTLETSVGRSVAGHAPLGWQQPLPYRNTMLLNCLHKHALGELIRHQNCVRAKFRRLITTCRQAGYGKALVRQLIPEVSNRKNAALAARIDQLNDGGRALAAPRRADLTRYFLTCINAAITHRYANTKSAPSGLSACHLPHLMQRTFNRRNHSRATRYRNRSPRRSLNFDRGSAHSRNSGLTVLGTVLFAALKTLDDYRSVFRALMPFYEELLLAGGRYEFHI